MDRANRKHVANTAGLATYGRGRAVRLPCEDLYSSDVPIHFTICADAGRPFEDDAVAQMVCHAIETSTQLLGFHLFVYCLMPDHLHLVVSPDKSRTDASAFLQKFKSFTTNQYQKLRGPARLWQPSARDRLKRENEDLRVLIRYIADNPVRRQLVACWLDWPYTRVFIEL